MAVIPFVFVEWGQTIADTIGVQVPQVISIIILAILAAEVIRLKLGITIFGQREYEAKQVSALAWGAFGVGVVFLLAPTEAYAWPLILSLAFGDPFMAL